MACVNCNSIKGKRNNSRDGYTWPDDAVTWSPFEYLPEGRVKVRGDLPASDRIKAERLFDLVGLGRTPMSDPTVADSRSLLRLETWQTAEMAQSKLGAGHIDVEVVTVLAKATGFWSVWMKLFEENEEVRAGLRDAFSGTR